MGKWQHIRKGSLMVCLVTSLVLMALSLPGATRTTTTKTRRITLETPMTLHMLAKQYLGSADKWKVLQKLNRRLARRLHNNPDRSIAAGTRIRLPADAVISQATTAPTAVTVPSPQPGPTSAPGTPTDRERALQQTGLVDTGATLKGKIRVAILPFMTPREQPDVEQYGPGTMDSLIVALKVIPKFIMLDRGRIEQVIKEQALAQTGLVEPRTALPVGKLLQAQTLVSGSIQTAGKGETRQIVIVANFIDVKTGEITQTLKVRGVLQDIFDLQEQLANLFVKSQQLTTTADQAQRMNKVLKSTGSLTAYDHYLQGRKAFLLLSAAGWADAAKSYQKAIETDPGYALAYAALAQTWSYWGFYKMKNGEPFQTEFKQAYETSRKALELNPNLAEAHRAYGEAIMLTSPGFLARKLDEETLRAIEGEMRKALELNPNDAETWYDFWFLSGKGNDPDHEFIRKALALNPDLSSARTDRAAVLVELKRFDEALAELREIVRITPNSAVAHSNLGQALNRLRRYEEAIPELREAIRLDPNYAAAHMGLGGTLARLNRYEEAIPEVRETLRLNPNNADAHFLLGYIYHLLERWDDATHEYEATLRLRPNHPQTSILLPEAREKRRPSQ